MIRHNGEYRLEERFEMRGGKGTVKIEHLWEPKTQILAPNRLMARITLEPGCSVGFHPHDGEEELYYILSGQALVNDDGVETILNVGDCTLTGNGAGLAIACSGNEPLVIMAIVSSYNR